MLGSRPEAMLRERRCRLNIRIVDYLSNDYDQRHILLVTIQSTIMCFSSKKMGFDIRLLVAPNPFIDTRKLRIIDVHQKQRVPTSQKLATKQ